MEKDSDKHYEELKNKAQNIINEIDSLDDCLNNDYCKYLRKYSKNIDIKTNFTFLLNDNFIKYLKKNDKNIKYLFNDFNKKNYEELIYIILKKYDNKVLQFQPKEKNDNISKAVNFYIGLKDDLDDKFHENFENDYSVYEIVLKEELESIKNEIRFIESKESFKKS